MARILAFDHGISAIDSEYIRPALDAIHLVVEGDRAAIVDTATPLPCPGCWRTTWRSPGPEGIGGNAARVTPGIDKRRRVGVNLRANQRPAGMEE